MIQQFVSISILNTVCLWACYFGYVCMAEKFCKGYLEISRFNEKLYVGAGFCGGMFIDAVGVRYAVPNMALALFYHIFFIGLTLLLFRGSTEKKILVFSILTTIKTLVENFCTSFFSCLLLVWRHTVKNIHVPFLEEGEINLIICISLIITSFVLYRGAKHFTSVIYNKTRRWYMIMSFPLLAVILIVDVANWGASNGIFVRSGGSMGLYYDQIFSHMGFSVLTALSAFGTGCFVFGMNKIYLEQKKSSQYHFQIAAYKMLEEQYRQSERLRHDLKNHILALLGLLEHKEWEKMENYLKKMEEGAGLGMGEEVTGNRVVDILLYQKRKMAESKNIIWECDVQVPGICCIDEFDLCVLFGNILDNAVEACERLQHHASGCSQRPFIHMQAGAVKKCFLLEVKNSADMEAQHRIGFTNKENPQEHGIGLLNISDVVRKYNGVMNMEIQNGVFVISILVPLTISVHDIKQAV